MAASWRLVPTRRRNLRWRRRRDRLRRCRSFDGSSLLLLFAPVLLLDQPLLLGCSRSLLLLDLRLLLSALLGASRSIPLTPLPAALLIHRPLRCCCFLLSLRLSLASTLFLEQLLLLALGCRRSLLLLDPCLLLSALLGTSRRIPLTPLPPALLIRRPLLRSFLLLADPRGIGQLLRRSPIELHLERTLGGVVLPHCRCGIAVTSSGARPGLWIDAKRSRG